MQKRQIAVAGGLVLASILADTAVAQRGADSFYRPPAFSDLDIDRNGVLTRAEVQARTPMYGVWTQVDVNSDGLIDSSEFAAFEVDRDAVLPEYEEPRGESYRPGTPDAQPGARDSMR